MTEAEFIARAFHEIYEKLAPTFGLTTVFESRVPWEDISDRNRNFMITTVQQLLDDGTIISGTEAKKHE